MSLSLSGESKRLAAFSFVMMLLFFSIVYHQNHTTLIVTMEKPEQTVLHPKIYYTAEGKPFSEKKSIKPMKVVSDQYYFLLPDLEAIDYIRLDPSTSAIQHMSIKYIEIVHLQWFTKTIYTLSIDNVKPLNQIDQFRTDAHQVSFSSAGNDPQLLIRFSLKKSTATMVTHFDLLFVL